MLIIFGAVAAWFFAAGFNDTGRINLIADAEALLATGRREVTERLFRDAIEADPTDVKAYIGLKECSVPVPIPTSRVTPLSAFGVASGGPQFNVIIISIDTLRVDRLYCYGNERATSPTIDEFVKKAVFFENAASQAPSTAPSHMSIFTGLMPDVHLIRNYGDGGLVGGGLSPSIRTLAQIFREHGYCTAGIHGGGNVWDGLGFNRGFDYYVSNFRIRDLAPGKLPIAVNNWLRKSRREGCPLFLFLHHFYCHEPYVHGTAEYRRSFLSNPDPSLPDSPDDVPEDGAIIAFRERLDLSRPDHLEHTIALYDGGVAYSDFLFAELIQLMKLEGFYENSLIVLLSDHGEEFNGHGDRGHGRLYAEHLNVPLIIKFPGGAFSGMRISRPVRLVDLMPTVLDYAGISVGSEIQGVSFLGLLRGEAGYNPPIVSFSNDLRHLRLVSHGYAYTQEGGDERLFAIATDLGEERDISTIQPLVLGEMRKIARTLKAEKKKYLHLFSGRSSSVGSSGSPELARDLRALGYMN